MALPKVWNAYCLKSPAIKHILYFMTKAIKVIVLFAKIWELKQKLISSGFIFYYSDKTTIEYLKINYLIYEGCNYFLLIEKFLSASA